MKNDVFVSFFLSFFFEYTLNKILLEVGQTGLVFTITISAYTGQHLPANVYRIQYIYSFEICLNDSKGITCTSFTVM